VQVLVVAGLINTFAELLLPVLCYFSVAFHITGVIVLAAWTRVKAPSPASTSFILTEYNNETGFQSTAYVVVIGLLSAASTFTGYVSMVD